MSNRYTPNPSENRFGRDRSPTRFDRRAPADTRERESPFEQHGPYNPKPISAREPPRGPKAQIGRGGFAPRGRGFGRGDTRDREFRDDTYLKGRGRGQDWEARDRFDARDRRPSSPSRTRSRSPYREPRDPDARFRRRDSREGLPPGGDVFPARGRGGYRGRGRGDYEGVKNRPYFNDDRPYESFNQPRDRQWDTPRDYPLDQPRRDDDIRNERERDREREPYRADPIAHRSDSRSSFGASHSTSTTDLQAAGADSLAQSSRSLGEGNNDHDRRPYSAALRDKPRDSDVVENAYRRILQERTVSRPSSPIQAPAVPAFGSILPQAIQTRDASDNTAPLQAEEIPIHPSRRALLEPNKEVQSQDTSPIRAPTAPRAQSKHSQEDLTRPPTATSSLNVRPNDDGSVTAPNWSRRFNPPSSAQGQGPRPPADVPSVRKALEEEGKNGNMASTLRTKPTNDPNLQGPPMKIPTGPRAGPSGPPSIRQPMQTVKQPSIRAPMGRGGPTMMGRGRGAQPSAWSWVNPNSRPAPAPRGPSIMSRAPTRRDWEMEEDRFNASQNPPAPSEQDTRRQRHDIVQPQRDFSRDPEPESKSVLEPVSTRVDDAQETFRDEANAAAPGTEEEEKGQSETVEQDMFDDDDLQSRHEKELRLLEKKRPPRPSDDRVLLKLLDDLEVFASAIKEVTENPEQTLRYRSRRQISPEQTERQVEEDEVDAQSDGASDDSDTDSRPGTPSLDSLPFLRESSWTSLSDVDDGKTSEDDELIKVLVRTRLENDRENKFETERQVRGAFVRSFKHWRRDVDVLDASNKEEHAREASTPPESSLEPTSVPQTVRSRRIVSDYGYEAIIKESMETAAREDQARREKEEREAQIYISASDSCNPDREAVVPAMLSQAEVQDSTFLDNNDLIEPGNILEAYRYAPPKDDFTKKEHTEYLFHYVTMPKRFGDIATKLEGRDYKSCVRHYYASKKTINYRNQEHKFLKSGRGKKFREASERANGARPRGGLLAALDAPADQAVPGAASLTESGRPRRAAAPTFGDVVDGDNTANVPPPPSRRSTFSKEGTTASQGNERPTVRRGKTATGQKPGRKPKGQQLLAAAPTLSQSPSPMKATSHGKDFHTPEPIPEIPREEDKDAVAAQLLANLPNTVQNMSMNAPLPEVWSTPGQAASNTTMSTPIPTSQPLDPNQILSMQAAQAAKQQGGETTSYWSVPEKQDFINYINYFGTDWAKIAQTMKTKSTTMVCKTYVL